MSKSTNSLNKSIERMTTGYKINRASDDAAGYSVARTMEVKMSSCSVAKTNAEMGISYINTASNTLDSVNTILQRIRDLAEEAANGTYDDDSRKAMQSEVEQKEAEISRIMSGTEYNGKKIFGSGSFINQVSTISEEDAVAQGYTLIKTADDLQNIKNNYSGKYILMNDIDLSGYSFSPIGSASTNFIGTFNGNGHVIKNLTINNPTLNRQALFGYVGTGALIENVGVEDANVTGQNDVGILVGYSNGITVDNCYTTGVVSGNRWVGGMSATNQKNSKISNCYSNATIYATYQMAGGLSGNNTSSSITNSYATGNILSTGQGNGGLVGVSNGGTITKSYATGYVTGIDWSGGLVGEIYNGASIVDSYATGSVSATEGVGGLTGGNDTNSSISGSYATGSVSGTLWVGGLAGSNQYSSNITNSYSTGKVTGTGTNVAGFLGNNSDESTYSNVYYDKETSEQSKGVGTGTDTVTALTTEALSTMIQNGTLPDYSLTSPKAKSVSSISFDVGIDSSENSIISADTGLSLSLAINLSSTTSSRNALSQVDELLKKVSSKQTELGSIYNRLDSASSAIDVSLDNLISSHSTIKDADISTESSEYIKSKILQQASASLLMTANQTPSIALQLI